MEKTASVNTLVPSVAGEENHELYIPSLRSEGMLQLRHLLRDQSDILQHQLLHALDARGPVMPHHLTVRFHF